MTEIERLKAENEQLRKDLMSFQAGISQCERMLDEAKAQLKRYVEYKRPPGE